MNQPERSPSQSDSLLSTVNGGHAPGVAAIRWLLALALLYTLYFTKTLLMPIVVSVLFASLLTPLVTWLKRFYVPRSLSALLLLACIGGPFTVLGLELAERAETWMKRIPELSGELSKELDSLTASLSPKEPAPPQETRDSGGFSFFGLFDEEEQAPPPAPKETSGKSALTERMMTGGAEMILSLLSSAPVVIVQLLTFALLVLFQLIFGKRVYESAIELFPRVHDKRQASLLVGRVQQALSRYILTVSLINTGLGLTVALVLWLLGVDDAILWGALVGLLNFAPYVGPLVAFCILSVAGFVQFGLEWVALIPTVIYFAINLVEAQLVTPLVLGHHMHLNPLILILWIVIWGWLWGAAGVLLAVPLLVCLKLTAQQLGVMSYWVQLIETRA